MRSGATHLEVEVHVSFMLLRSVALYVGTFYMVYPIVGFLLRSYSSSSHDSSLPSAILTVARWLFIQLKIGWDLLSSAYEVANIVRVASSCLPSPHHVAVLVFNGIFLLWYLYTVFFTPAEAR